MKMSTRPASRARRLLLSAALLLLLIALFFAHAPRSPFNSTVHAQSITEIHTIQGSGTTSPLVGQTVTTTGIVTAVRTGSSGGFFLQSSDNDTDDDPNTSEGIFVFTGSAGSALAVPGNLLQVTGTVQEFKPSADPNSAPLTELAGTLTISQLSTGNPLPVPITLTATDTSPTGSLEQLERCEGMRVRVASLTVIAPTQGNVSEANATAASNGIFFGVISRIARPFREPGIELPDPLPAGAPATIPRFDGNPERLRIDSATLSGAIALEVTAGAIVNNLTGPLNYVARNWAILVDPPGITPTPNASGNASATPVTAPSTGEFTVASFNLERFFDTINDPATSDVVLTTTAFNNRLNKASLAIRHVMRTPDIIGVEEMENLTTLQAVAAKVNTDAVASGESNPNYQAYLVEGNDPGGIDVGFLVKSSRVNVLEVTQTGREATYINPNNSQADLLNDRPPLLLRATLTAPSGSPFAITVIVNHLRSLLNIDDAVDGNRVRTKRRAQAEYLASLIQARQVANPNERLIVVGDFNAFEVNDGFVDVIGTIKGTPAPASAVTLASSDLVNPDLTDLVDTVPADQRYSFSFNGNAQVIDHVLVTTNLLTRVKRLEYARNNADFPESFRNDPTRPERISDHDLPVVAIAFTSVATTVSAASYNGAKLAAESIVAAFGTEMATGTAAAASLPLPTALAGTTIKVRDSANVERLAPLFFVSPNQLNYQLPPGTANGAATITITSSDGSIASGTSMIASVAPAVFAADASGQGIAAATALRVRADNSQSYEPVSQFDAAQSRFVAVPVDLGPVSDQVFLIMFGTGLRFRSSLVNVSATIGGDNARVDYAGPQGGFVGLDQLNILIPRSLAGRGEAEVVLLVDGQKANTVKVKIK